MSKSKKNIVLIVISIILLAIVIGAIVLVIKNKNTNNQENTLTSKLCKKISEANEISYKRTIDENNKITVIVKGDKAYKEVISDGNTTKYIVKNGNTFYLDDDEKKYYKYENNDEILIEVKEQFKNLNLSGLKVGKESINGKNYKYEEIQQCQDFLFDENLSVNNLEYANTRLYYKNENLSYIKTIVGENQELIKVDISYGNINDSYFDIPSDYTEV